MSTHTLEHLVHVYGLPLVFLITGLQALGAPLPGTTALIAAAVYAASAHGLPIAGVIAAGALGALAGTCGGFGLGRLAGEPILLWLGRRLRQRGERVQALRREFAVHGGAWLFVGRFISGLRNVTGLLAGASDMPLRRFLAVSAAAALAWASINALEYYWFGRALERADTWLQVVLVLVGIAWMVISVRLLRRRALRSLAKAGGTAAEASGG